LEASRGIRDRRVAVQRISDDFRLNAFNAHIATHPLGAEGATLGTVAQLFNAHAQTLSQHVDALASHIEQINEAVADMAASLCSARIQLEMLLSFICESVDSRADAAERHRLHALIDQLRIALGTTLSYGLRAVDTIQRRVPAVVEIGSYLSKDVVYLQVAQTAGLIELSRLTNVESLQTTFVELRVQIATGERELKHLESIIAEIRSLTDAAPAHVTTIDTAMKRVEETLTQAKAAADTGTAGMEEPALDPTRAMELEDEKFRKASGDGSVRGHTPREGEYSPHIGRGAAMAPCVR